MTDTIGDLGKITQIAYVVTDLEREIAHWTGNMGVGPFFVTPHLDLVNKRYRGKPTDVDMSAAITYWGDIQVELILQHNDAPSTFSDWVKAGGIGIHHIGIAVDSLEVALIALETKGGVVVQEHEAPGIAAAAYVEMPGQGPIVEAVEMAPALRVAFEKIREIAASWDGSNPVRSALPD